MPGRWLCRCGQENLQAEAACRACGALAPRQAPREAPREEPRERRLERLKARAERGALRAKDLVAAHVEGAKMGPELKGWEEPAPRHKRDMEAYKHLLRFAAWKAQRNAEQQ